MKRLLLLMATTALTATTMIAQPVPQWPEVTREMKPGSRWWWLGSAVDEQNLRWNIAEYARTGLGTLEITPIYGVVGNEKNELQFLSEQWLQALKTCQEAGEQGGVDIDMNCGTGWPFGGPTVKLSEAAGKLVYKNETLTADGTQTLTFSVTAPEGNASLSKVMAYQQDGDGQVVDVTEHVDGNTLRWQAPAGQWLLLAIYNGHTGQQVKRAAPGGEGYVLDHYDATAVKNYLQRFDTQFAKFGAQWPHSFFNDSYEVYGADWTPKMFEQFEQYRGYKLQEHMDQLLGLGKRKDTGNQVLADYRQTLSDMLLNNFTRQWADWAHGHGATVRNQGHGSPGNLLDFYAAVDIPEIESFGISDFKIKGLRQDPGFTSQNLSDLATLKYASSAAHVTGKKLTSSETFTWLAEHFRVSLSQMKPDLDLFFLAGVNHIFFHGTTYSPQEAQWPGWKFYASIDMSPTNSIWRDAPALMQYATRCQSFLQMGQPDNDVLVYAPFQDAMHKNTGSNAARLQLFDINTLSQKIPSLPTTVSLLQDAGLDCDFISDALLSTTIYTNGVLQTAAGQQYKALVVPVSTNMPEATKQHLDELAAQGAVIVYGNTAATISSLGLTGEPMRTELGLRTIRRKTATGHHYFISNLSAKDIEGMVPLAVPFINAWLYNPMTGSISKAHFEEGRVWLSLKSGESIILQTFGEGTAGGVVPQTTDVPVVEMAGMKLNGDWTLQFDTKEAATPIGNKPSTWETMSGRSDYMGTGIYSTTFSVDAKTIRMANGGFRLDLGDVRESARVYLNGDSIGTAWSAPFVVDISGHVKEGTNELRIEVTNLPANRIRQMDIDGVAWRKFKDVNILDIVGGNTSVANQTYNNWELVPSGLNAAVKLIPLRQKASELVARLVTFTQQGEDYYPTYRLESPSGEPVTTVSVTDTDGAAFNDYVFADGMLTVTGQTSDFIVVKDGQGGAETYLRAYGAYQLQRCIDFTVDVAPACNWQVMTNKAAINGFSGTYDWRRAPEKNSTTLAELYEGVTAQSEKSTYYFYYPTCGMAATNDFVLQATALAGDLALLSYLIGSSAKPAYNAADSLIVLAQCDDAGIVFELPSRTQNYLYRMLLQYRPKSSPTSVTSVLRQPTNDYYYTLQGLRTRQPRQGIYIRNGRKVWVK